MGYTYRPRLVFGITLSENYLERRPENTGFSETPAVYGAFRDARKVWQRIQIVYVETRHGCLPCLAFASNDAPGTYLGHPRPTDDVVRKILSAMKLEKPAAWYREID
ncbi:hypothetical protein D9757_007817 [Collybiopsis confluens]|uniref:Uncharacterized protein n=1 Tax=Collybiopsis confluens TaxID=2823264 RepID=A0A8H5HQ42_9AGAR|nr:hypothetical protein D9757_007817 [Collybiopsis confluens]